MEKWKAIKIFDICLKVSDAGKVKKDEKLLKPTDNGNGYLRLNIKTVEGQKTVYIHRLVAEAFCENTNGYGEINHKDENKKNNNANNLEWVSHKTNCNYGTRNIRVKRKISKKIYCVENGLIFNSVNDAALSFGVLKTAISNCLNERSKTCGGYHWKYADI